MAGIPLKMAHLWYILRSCEELNENSNIAGGNLYKISLTSTIGGEVYADLNPSQLTAMASMDITMQYSETSL